jgi:hypothetical protein
MRVGFIRVRGIGWCLRRCRARGWCERGRMGAKDGHTRSYSTLLHDGIGVDIDE